MTPAMQRKYCVLNDECTKILRFAMDRLSLSARAYDRILKVARTIADLDANSTIEHPAEINSMHLSEAINYRALDRANWG